MRERVRERRGMSFLCGYIRFTGWISLPLRESKWLHVTVSRGMKDGVTSVLARQLLGNGEVYFGHLFRGGRRANQWTTFVVRCGPHTHTHTHFHTNGLKEILPSSSSSSSSLCSLSFPPKTILYITPSLYRNNSRYKAKLPRPRGETFVARTTSINQLTFL